MEQLLMGKSVAHKQADKALEKLPLSARRQAQNLITRDVVQRFRSIAPKAIKTLEALLEDPDTPHETKRKVAGDILNRAYGAVPKTTVHAMVGQLEGKTLEQEAKRILEQRGVVIDATSLPAPISPSRRLEGGGVGTGSPAHTPKTKTRRQSSKKSGGVGKVKATKK